MALLMRTELLFPPRLIRDLKNLRGETWRQFVERLLTLPETHPDVLAFCLLIIRLGGCLGCVSGSYRFMRGCEVCSQQTVARFQGTDEELIELYERARQALASFSGDPLELVPETVEPEIEEGP